MILFNLIRLLTHRRYSMALTSLYPSFCYQFQNFRKIKNNFWNKFVLQHLILINQNTGCILIERKVFYVCFMKITFSFWHWWFLLKPNPSHDDVTAWKRFGNTLYIYIYIYTYMRKIHRSLVDYPRKGPFIQSHRTVIHVLIAWSNC